MDPETKWHVDRALIAGLVAGRLHRIGREHGSDEAILRGIDNLLRALDAPSPALALEHVNEAGDHLAVAYSRLRADAGRGEE